MSEQQSELEKDLFDSNKYSTVFIHKDADSPAAKKGNTLNATIIDLLVNNHDPALKHKALDIIKKEKLGIEVLLKAIADPKNEPHQATLVAACWEAGIDCSRFISFFIILALNPDFKVAMEAITVIEDMMGPFPENGLDNAIEKIEAHLQQENTEAESKIFLEDLLIHLQGKNE